MPTSILGARIRQRRKELGVTQAELARQVGVSASYLNLIEWNKRRIAGALLRKIAEALNLSLEEIDGMAERRLLETLNEIARLPAISSLGIEEQRTSELIGRFPGWSRALAVTARMERQSATRAQVLSDRLSNDPFLSETVHKMLTRIAAVRSLVEILNDFEDIPEDRQARFTGIVYDECQSLSSIGEALAAYLDKAEDLDKVMTPIDEVEGFLQANEHRFPEIEGICTNLSSLMDAPHPVSRRANAKALVEEHAGEIINRVIAGESGITTAAAKRRAQGFLADYMTGAILMPDEVFAERAAELNYDIEALAESFSVEVELVCLRLTALPRGNSIPRFGYLRANAAGMIIEMHSLPNLVVPRYAAACPLWVLFSAQQSPETVIRQRVLFPSGDRFVFLARARHWGATGFGKPRYYLTDMVAMSEADAQLTVYAPDPSALVEEVGPGCRLCPRESCHHRVVDPLTE